MALFGGSRRKPAFNLDDGTQQAVDAYASMAPAPEPAKPSSFWQGGDKFRWQDGLAGALAAFGDAMAQRSGMPVGATQSLAGGRMDALELARKAREGQMQMDAARQRAVAAGLTAPQADMLAHGNAKYGDFKPPNNDTAADYEFWKSRMTPEQFAAYVQNKADPPQYRQGPDGQFYRIQTQAPPSITEDDWNKGQVLGGGVGNGTGGFPRRHWR